MKIERRKAESLLLTYRDYINTEDSHITMSEWMNGEGYDISWNSPHSLQMASLSYTDIDAFVALYSASKVSEPKEE